MPFVTMLLQLSKVSPIAFPRIIPTLILLPRTKPILLLFKTFGTTKTMPSLLSIPLLPLSPPPSLLLMYIFRRILFSSPPPIPCLKMKFATSILLLARLVGMTISDLIWVLHMTLKLLWTLLSFPRRMKHFSI